MMVRRLGWLIVSWLLLLSSCIPVERNRDVATPVSPVTVPRTTPNAISATPALTDTALFDESTDMPAQPPDGCPITMPPRQPFTPPAPYPSQAPQGYSWYGTESLWTVIPDAGVWSELPHNTDGYFQKVLWWHAGYSPTDEPVPALSVSGRRLDAPAPPLQVSEPTNAMSEEIHSAMLVGVTLPTTGCWEISGRYGDAQLSFVVWVTS